MMVRLRGILTRIGVVRHKSLLAIILQLGSSVISRETKARVLNHVGPVFKVEGSVRWVAALTHINPILMEVTQVSSQIIFRP